MVEHIPAHAPHDALAHMDHQGGQAVGADKGGPVTDDHPFCIVKYPFKVHPSGAGADGVHRVTAEHGAGQGQQVPRHRQADRNQQVPPLRRQIMSQLF